MKRDDLNQEMRAHLQEKTYELMERGLSESEARAQALREFGNRTRHLEDSRNAWRWPSFDRLLQDLRHALRALRRNPGFTAVAVLTLAIGIGANTAIFSAANAVLIQPLPYPAADRLTWITTHAHDEAGETVFAPDYFDWLAQSRSFDAMLAYDSSDRALNTDLGAFEARVASVSGDFWAITGSHPSLGRAFNPGETMAIVLSHAFFEQRFGANPAIVGRGVTLNDEPATVVGIMPAGFHFLFPSRGAVTAPPEPDAYVASPLTPASQQRGSSATCENTRRKKGDPCLKLGAAVSVVARLKPGVPVEAARAEIGAIEARIAAQWSAQGEYKGGRDVRLLLLRDRLVESSRPALVVLLASVGFLLLIACSNVANLLLARLTARQTEISIRFALGAGAWRVARQLLTESLVLSFLGGGFGVLLAHGAIRLLARFGPSGVPRLQQISLDARVFLFALGVSIFTGILFGIGPAFAARQGSLHDVLKQTGRSASAGITARLTRGLLAAGEIALALVLLSGAGLLIKSFWVMNQHVPGFDPERILVMKVPLTGPRYQDLQQRIAYFDQALRRLNRVTGVESAAIGNMGSQLVVSPPHNANFPPGTVFGVNTASEGYREALGLRLLEGRWITDEEPEKVIVVNQTYARLIAPGQDPIGKQAFGSTIVGVVADLRYSKLDADVMPEEYQPYRDAVLLYDVNLIVRTRQDPLVLAPILRRLVASIDPSQPVYDVQTLEQSLAGSIAPRRFNMLLLAIFAAIAMLLAAVGIYGVLSYAVAQRTREIGVRVALGARQSEVVAMVVKQGMLVTGAGSVAGLACALWLTRLMSSLLYGVQPWDAPTFIAVCGSLILAALAACWIPARRAARVDPLIALRYE